MPNCVLQVLQQVEHLRLHRDVERADRLVGDDQLRLRDQRARDRDALALAAGEFVRVLVHVGVAQADLLQHRGDARRAARRASHAPSAVSGSATMRATVWRGSSEP